MYHGALQLHLTWRHHVNICEPMVHNVNSDHHVLRRWLSCLWFLWFISSLGSARPHPSFQECLKVLSVCIAVYLRWEHMPQWSSMSGVFVSAGKSSNHVLGWFHFDFKKSCRPTLQVSWYLQLKNLEFIQTPHILLTWLLVHSSKALTLAGPWGGMLHRQIPLGVSHAFPLFWEILDGSWWI